ncbi:TPA: hypothetical protein ACGSJV_005121, partial [Escherichia coli]
RARGGLKTDTEVLNTLNSCRLFSGVTMGAGTGNSARWQKTKPRLLEQSGVVFWQNQKRISDMEIIHASKG